MTFNKYEFTPTEWETLKKQIQQTTESPSGEEVTSWVGCAVHEIGFIVITPAIVEDMEVKTQAVVSDKWAVDILWDGEPLPSFASYAVFPKPHGVHVFSGCESLYLKSFCEKFPDSEYCIVPKPNETL